MVASDPMVLKMSVVEQDRVGPVASPSGRITTQRPGRWSKVALSTAENYNSSEK